MMVLPVVIGIGAGLATALLFAALATATPLALPLFMLSPLPIAIASLGWGWVSGGIGVLVAGLALAAALMAISFSPLTGIVLAVTFALPVVWLAHLGTLSRPVKPDESEGAREWFPYGLLLVHAVFLVTLLVALGGATLGYEPETMAAGTVEAMNAWVASQPPGTGLVRPEDVPRLASLVANLLPYSAASLTLLMLVVSLWLAARITSSSGLLLRPLVPFSTTTLPMWMAGVFALGLIATQLPFPLGAIAGVVVGATAMAFTLTGLAAIHVMTQGQAARGPILAGVYVASLLFGFPILVVLVLGIADSILDLRSRFGRAPPSNPPNR
jgi:hypothetical protein